MIYLILLIINFNNKILAILDSVKVPFKDNSASLKDIAQVIVKDPQTLLVHVHEEEVWKAK